MTINKSCMKCSSPALRDEPTLTVILAPDFWILNSPSGKKGRKCETNPISFKTYCPSNANNEKISVFVKRKSYDLEDRAYDLQRRSTHPARRRCVKASQAWSSQVKAGQGVFEKNIFSRLKPDSICDSPRFGRLWKAMEAPRGTLFSLTHHPFHWIFPS